jgi:hypothetical protein
MMLRPLFLACLLTLIGFTLQAQPAIKEDPALMPETEIKAKLASLSRIYKLDSTALAGYDKIITYDREVFLGRIHNITFSEVRYTCPPNNALIAINKSRISQILYTDGRRDVFIPLDDRTVRQKELVDTSRIIVKSQRDWMKVMVTENPSEVVNLTPIGHLTVNYEASMGNAGNEELMRQASLLLKKKAAVLKAHCVLIDTKFFRKSYGDLPKVEVTARAYGY